MSKFGLLYEIAKSEDFSQYDMNFIDTMSSIRNNLDKVATLPTPIKYTAEMVNVIGAKDNNNNDICLIEAENLFKYMESEGLEVGDIETAISNVAHANGVEVNNIALVIDSNKKIAKCCEEAAKLKEKTDVPIKRLQFMSSLVMNCYNKGIQVVKRAD